MFAGLLLIPAAGIPPVPIAATASAARTYANAMFA